MEGMEVQVANCVWPAILEDVASKANVEKNRCLLSTVLQNLLTQVTDDEEGTQAVRILTITCSNEKFLDAVKAAIINWSSKQDKHELLGELLELLQRFCQEVLIRIPFLGKDVLLDMICICIGVTAGAYKCQQTHPNLLGEFTALQKKIEEVNKLFVVEKKKQNPEEDDLLHCLEPPEDFREIPIIPTLDELINETHPFLRPNRVFGSYRSSEHYLDVQFRLLREDFVQPLRLGVQNFMKNKEEFIRTRGRRRNTQEQDGSVRLYNDLIFCRSEKSSTDPNVTEYLFNLPSRLVNKVNWNKSKRLLSGCLVMLTPDYCQTAIFAVTVPPPLEDKKVTQRDNVDPRRRELAQGILRLSIETGKEFVDKKKTYLMFECEAYLEAYRYNLEILQKLFFLENDGPQPNPLNKIIVRAASNEIGPPLYWELLATETEEDAQELELRVTRTENIYVNPLRPETWPRKEIQQKMSLDPDQYNAWEKALSSELAVIQGPPGTGKTYVGLQIVKTLLHNKEHGYLPESPILVLCYTNHALDQFLELILREMPRTKMVRIGGQSKSDVVKSHSLQQHRRNLRYNDGYSDAVKLQKFAERTALEEVTNLEALLKSLKGEISELDNPSGIFNWNRMEVGQRLRKVIPSHLWDTCTKDCTWLALREENFQVHELPVGDIVKHLFMVKPKPKCVDPIIKPLDNDGTNLKLNKTSEEEGDMAVEDDQEEHDLNEILANRLEEDDFEEYRSSAIDRAEKYTNPFIYMTKCSVTQCRNGIAMNDNMLRRAYSNYNQHTQQPNEVRFDEVHRISQEITRLQWENVEYQNRANLFSTIFGLFKEGRLEMPNLERIFHKLENVNKYVLGTRDVQRLPIRLKWGIYFKIQEIARQLAKVYKEQTEIRLEESRRKYVEERNRLDGCILRDAQIIGMTTTGAAKNHELLEIAKPEVVVVEEAAEILEAHIVTALTEDCKHLILIGDHQQLQPSTAVWKLATKFRLNVSLFERFILNDVSFCTLKTQHRMRPEISNLIIGPIYEDLHDHPKVFEHPKVKGVKKSLFFISHREREAVDVDLLSKSNYHEASFLVSLCEYLLKQGYQPQQVTILATYMGQMFQLRKILPDTCRGVRITCVDNFQGEENDVILLSLVRSNDNDDVGFVKKDNRICVALSRARHGLYVIGNMDGMTKASKTWRKIQAKLKDGGNISTELELICERHGNVTNARKASHFEPLVSGGCTQKCEAILECTHVCHKICHARDQEHLEYQCKERCLKKCSLGHQCQAVCSIKCPRCYVPVNKTLPCGHGKTIACSSDPTKELCMVPVTKAFDCKHELEVECHQDMKMLKCMVLSEKVLPCGHVRMVECHLPPEQVKCDVTEERKLPCEHLIVLKCHQPLDTVKCDVVVNRELKCGHFRKQKCHLPVDGIKCDVKVEKELTCGHSRTLKCYQEIKNVQCDVIIDILVPGCLHIIKLPCSKSLKPVCTIKCDRVLPFCGHACRLPCHFLKDPDHETYKCMEWCERSCESGHLCPFKHHCFKKCLPCEVLVEVDLECGHKLSIPCAKNKAEEKCRKRVRKMLPCGHKQRVLCHMDPAKHQCTEQITNCQEKCTRGHQCAFEHACHEGCPPCVEKLEKALPCGHQVLLECHDPGFNYKCTERMERKLPCGHTRKLKCSIVPLRADCDEVVKMKCRKCLKDVDIECRKEEGQICDKCTRDKFKGRGECTSGGGGHGWNGRRGGRSRGGWRGGGDRNFQNQTGYNRKNWRK